MPQTIGDITQELTEKVLTPAKEEADVIVREAEKKAGAIVEAAQVEAKKVIADAEADADKTKKQLEVDMEMAARDFILTLQEKIEGAVVKPVAEQDLKNVLGDEEIVKELIETLFEQFLKTRTNELRLEVVLPKEHQQELETWFVEKFREKMSEMVIVHFTDDISFGFHVGTEEEDTYLNFSNGLVESFVSFLSPRFRKCFFGIEES